MPNVKKTIDAETSGIVEMAWNDEVPFEAIQREYHLDESAVIKIMRNQLKRSSFKLWRKRVTGRKSKHLQRTKPAYSICSDENSASVYINTQN